MRKIGISLVAGVLLLAGCSSSGSTDVQSLVNSVKPVEVIELDGYELTREGDSLGYDVFGNDVIICDYTFKNTSDEAIAFEDAFYYYGFYQDDELLDYGPVIVNSETGSVADKYNWDDVNPGNSAVVSLTYVLKNKTDDIDVVFWSSLNDDDYVEYTIKISDLDRNDTTGYILNDTMPTITDPIELVDAGEGLKMELPSNFIYESESDAYYNYFDNTMVLAHDMYFYTSQDDFEYDVNLTENMKTTSTGIMYEVDDSYHDAYGRTYIYYYVKLDTAHGDVYGCFLPLSIYGDDAEAVVEDSEYLNMVNSLKVQ